MVFGEDQDQDHGDQTSRDKSQINLDVGEHDEPSIPVAGFELAGAFCAGDTTGWILPTVCLSDIAACFVERGCEPYSDTDQESVSSKRLKETRNAPVIAV